MCALLNYLPIVENYYFVAVLHGRESVGNHQGGVLMAYAVDSELHLCFGFVVKRRSGFVKAHDLGFLE
jgi:hypothetical protein